MTDNENHMFPGLEPPELPDDLPTLVLARAHAALRAPIRRADLWSRIRSSRGLQLAWATSVAALCVANLVLGGWMTPRPEAVPHAPATAVSTLEPEIESIVDLPPLRIAANCLSGIRGELRAIRSETENLS